MELSPPNRNGGFSESSKWTASFWTPKIHGLASCHTKMTKTTNAVDHVPNKSRFIGLSLFSTRRIPSEECLPRIETQIRDMSRYIYIHGWSHPTNIPISPLESSIFDDRSPVSRQMSEQIAFPTTFSTIYPHDMHHIVHLQQAHWCPTCPTSAVAQLPPELVAHRFAS